MCGFAGYIDFSGQQTPDEVLQKMTNSITHRGPDDFGTYAERMPNCFLGMGFRRLSIIDLSESGHQPMLLEDGSMAITFNGEVYNFAEIREELKALGHTFRSGSDTEVILKAFKSWGTSAVSRFIGMFSIALLDKTNQKFHLLRDRVGVKPLFYYYHNGLFLFGSELKAFHCHPGFKKEVDNAALLRFFQFGHVRNPLAIFKDTSKLTPGSCLTLDLTNGKISIAQYWDAYACFDAPKLKLDEKETIAEVHTLLKSAFQYRMIADVPVGIFLSGGYDSTCVSAILQSQAVKPLKTFTIGFEDPRYNEAPYAREVARILGTDHTEIICSTEFARETLLELPEIYDEPFGDSSAIPTLLVSRSAQQYVKVALSADGSDEIFGGYPRYFRSARMLDRYARIPGWIRQLSAGIINQLPLNTKNPARHSRLYKLRELLNAKEDFQRYLSIIEPMTFEEAALFLSPTQVIPAPYHEFPGINTAINDRFSLFQALEFWDSLTDDMLQKVDRASMSTSLEVREPFLDHRILEFIARIPNTIKVKNQTPKYLIREIVHQYVPKHLMERPKMGFGIPVETMSKTDFKEIILDTLSSHKVKTHGILNPRVVDSVTQQFYAGKTIDFQRFWFLFMFQLWANRWL
jgi:asparagine synthase (glutamine-hydrolysing)